MNPLTMLPAPMRRAIYVGYATIGILFGATQVGYATAGSQQPLWLLVGFGIFGYLGTALGLVAAANVVDVQGFGQVVARHAVQSERAARALADAVAASPVDDLDYSEFYDEDDE